MLPWSLPPRWKSSGSHPGIPGGPMGSYLDPGGCIIVPPLAPGCLRPPENMGLPGPMCIPPIIGSMCIPPLMPGIPSPPGIKSSPPTPIPIPGILGAGKPPTPPILKGSSLRGSRMVGSSARARLAGCCLVSWKPSSLVWFCSVVLLEAASEPSLGLAASITGWRALSRVAAKPSRSLKPFMRSSEGVVCRSTSISMAAGEPGVPTAAAWTRRWLPATRHLRSTGAPPAWSTA
mmetsp:Transcript_34104/g.96657  ORF Transcript_34104/g.96657 Transcript_34104/m.96657 type:complete len:233 (-) Transcript_34104:385-1083(-)